MTKQYLVRWNAAIPQRWEAYEEITRSVDYYNTEITPVIQYAMDNLASGRTSNETVKVDVTTKTGWFEYLTTTMKISLYTNFYLAGTLKLDPNLSTPTTMMALKAKDVHDVFMSKLYANKPAILDGNHDATWADQWNAHGRL